MIEKRTMWLLESSLILRQVVALFDLEKKQVVCYRYVGEDGDIDEDQDWSSLDEGDTFYNTEGEAKEARLRRIDDAKGKMKTCLSLIKELDNIAVSDDFDFKRKDYLGIHAKERDEDNYWEKRRKLAEEKVGMLVTIARRHFFNVAGQTINLDEVVRVLWGEGDDATLVMRDGTKVRTYSEAEIGVVVDMFGSNGSGRYIKY